MPRAGPLDYVNKHGVFKVDPSWESGLQVAAKLGWLLPLNPPLDYVAFRDLVHHVMPSGVAVSPEGFAALFLGHCLKWPPAVVVYRHNLSEVEGMTPVSRHFGPLSVPWMGKSCRTCTNACQARAGCIPTLGLWSTASGWV